MRRCCIAGLFLVFSLSAFAQSYADVDALVDTFFTKDPETIAKHLPSALQKSLSELPAARRAAFLHEMMLGEKLRAEGVTITRSGDGDVLVVMEKKTGEQPGRVEVVLDKRISDGYESMLRFRTRETRGESGDLPQLPDASIEAWMRFEDGEWHIFEVGASDTHSILKLDDPAFLKTINQDRTAANEASAVGSLRTYNTAIVTYEATYPDAGVPGSLTVLGGVAAGQEPDRDHALLLDPLLSTPPFEKSGYRFYYIRAGSTGENGRYTIVARPVQYGTTGNRNFFTDESGVIRFTEEDREPSSSDPPLR